MDIRIKRIMDIERIMDATRYGFPSGTNPLYSNLELRKIRRENQKIEPVKKLEQTNYSRDATKQILEKGRNLDVVV